MFVVKIGVGGGGRKAFHHQPLDIFINGFVNRSFGQPDQSAGKLVLQTGGLGGLAAGADGIVAAAAFLCAAALIAKHLIFHKNHFLLSLYSTLF